MALNDRSPVFANRLREARLRKNWTMAQLAKAAGTTRQNVSRLESQNGQQPKSQTVAALAEALGVDRAWLFYVTPSEGSDAA